MSDFKITWNIRGWSVLLSALLPVFVVIVFLVIGKAETHLSAPGESVFIIVASIITALKAGVLEEMLKIWSKMVLFTKSPAKNSRK